jgi:hypothetical protein
MAKKIAAYFYMMEKNNKKALELLEKSCSEKDPHSCYNVLKNEFALNAMKSRATEVLDSVCLNPMDNDKMCCQCYAELKKERVPANTP